MIANFDAYLLIVFSVAIAIVLAFSSDARDH